MKQMLPGQVANPLTVLARRRRKRELVSYSWELGGMWIAGRMFGHPLYLQPATVDMHGLPLP